jgi:hypothetical protein
VCAVFEQAMLGRASSGAVYHALTRFTLVRLTLPCVCLAACWCSCRPLPVFAFIHLCHVQLLSVLAWLPAGMPVMPDVLAVICASNSWRHAA